MAVQEVPSAGTAGCRSAEGKARRAAEDALGQPSDLTKGPLPSRHGAAEAVAARLPCRNETRRIPGDEVAGPPAAERLLRAGGQYIGCCGQAGRNAAPARCASRPLSVHSSGHMTGPLILAEILPATARFHGDLPSPPASRWPFQRHLARCSPSSGTAICPRCSQRSICQPPACVPVLCWPMLVSSSTRGRRCRLRPCLLHDGDGAPCNRALSAAGKAVALRCDASMPNALACNRSVSLLWRRVSRYIPEPPSGAAGESLRDSRHVRRRVPYDPLCLRLARMGAFGHAQLPSALCALKAGLKGTRVRGAAGTQAGREQCPHTTLKPGIAVESKHDGGRTATHALLPLRLCCAGVCPSAAWEPLALAECDRRIFVPFLLKRPWLAIVLVQLCFWSIIQQLLHFATLAPAIQCSLFLFVPLCLLCTLTYAPAGWTSFPSEHNPGIPLSTYRSVVFDRTARRHTARTPSRRRVYRPGHILGLHSDKKRRRVPGKRRENTRPYPIQSADKELRLSDSFHWLY
ncbi:hypothetical protein BKA66DRAFT_584892 [Pyrenochaeta sp. MPI-SDFR-AT-0127]|nr:hypothetical protein BKA66DRAFT_584892 [Pyrenochaeta sp. MPI-SDFR-AT-0127]